MSSLGSTPQESELVRVPETQTAQPSGLRKKPTRRHRKKQPGDPKTQRVAYKQWTVEEDVALARAWILISEDPDVAIFQANGIFWLKIFEAWLAITGHPEEYRGKEAVQAHWAGLNADSQKFAGIFNRLQGAGWCSGHNDADIITQALSDFQAQGQTEGRFGKPFKYLRCWEKLRHCAKWNGTPNVSVARRAGSSRPSKKSKTSSSTNSSTPNTPSDARNFKNDAVNLTDDEDVRELPQPCGRSRKNEGEGSLSRFNTATIEDVGQLNELVGRLEKNVVEIGNDLRAFNKNQEKLAQMFELRQMKEDYESLKAEGFHEEAALLHERRLQKIREYYGY